MKLSGLQAVSLEVLLKALVAAQREVDEITGEIKRRSDGRRRRTGSKARAVLDKKEKASS